MLANVQKEETKNITSYLGEWEKLYMTFKMSENTMNFNLESESPETKYQIFDSIR